MHTHAHTHTHTQQATPPALLSSSISALSRRVGLLMMPSPGRLNVSNDSPRGERQLARGLPHGDSCGVNTKLQQLVRCSSKSMSTSLLSIRKSLSTRMGGPWGRCGTSAVSLLGAVVHGWGVVGSRSLRIRFAMHAVRTCKCNFFPFVQTGIRTVPQNDLYQANSGCTAIFVTCVTCVCPPTLHGRVLKYWCFGRGGNRGKKNNKRRIFPSPGSLYLSVLR